MILLQPLTFHVFHAGVEGACGLEVGATSLEVRRPILVELFICLIFKFSLSENNVGMCLVVEILLFKNS